MALKFSLILIWDMESMAVFCISASKLICRISIYFYAIVTDDSPETWDGL